MCIYTHTLKTICCCYHRSWQQVRHYIQYTKTRMDKNQQIKQQHTNTACLHATDLYKFNTNILSFLITCYRHHKSATEKPSLV